MFVTSAGFKRLINEAYKAAGSTSEMTETDITYQADTG